MTDEHPLSRRRILASVGTLGAASAFGGLGTQALFNDEEAVSTTFTAGEVDIQLDWKLRHNGKIVETQEPIDTNGEIDIKLDDVKPCDEICLLLSLHQETNPAWIWSDIGVLVDDENGMNDPEKEAENGNGDGNDDFVCVSLGKLDEWNTAEHKFDVVDEEDPNGGSYLGPDPPRYEMFTPAGDSVIVRFEPVGFNMSDEAVEFEVESLTPGWGLCDIDVSAAAQTNSYLNEEECTTDVVTVNTPDAAGDQAEVSNVVLSVCETSDDGNGDGGELDECLELDVFYDDNQNWVLNEGERLVDDRLGSTTVAELGLDSGEYLGGLLLDGVRTGKEDEPLSPFFPSESELNIQYNRWYGTDAPPPADDDYGTQYISYRFEVPCNCGNEIQSDRLSLALRFYAEQARHNADPQNPWGGPNPLDSVDLVPEIDPPD